MGFDKPEDILDQYKNGLQGATSDPVDMAKLLSELPIPFFGDAGSEISGTGKGALSLPYKAIQKFFPSFGGDERQTTGDCLIAGTKVKMANGSLKNIEDIKIGESVVTHNNRIKPVESLVQKYPSNNTINDIYIKKYDTSLSMTDDHKVIVYTDYGYEWVEAKDLKVGDLLVIPKGINDKSQTSIDMSQYLDNVGEINDSTIRNKNSRYSLPRYVQWSSDLMWLLGIYAAEGGIDGKNKERITFNLNSSEVEIIERIKDTLYQIFQVKTTILNRTNKNVTCVRLSNIVISRFFSSMIKGNQWNKSIDNIIKSKQKYLLEAFVRGWVDGDGHLVLNRRRVITAVSVSKELIKDVSDILISLQIQHAIANRKPRNQSKEAWQINIYGEQVYKLFPEHKCSTVIRQESKQNKLICSLGLLAPITSIKTRQYMDLVYCINVEDDHSFIANNIAVHNCVSHATRNAVDVTRCYEIAVKGEKESFIARGATEPIYGSRGHGGQGMHCSQAARFVSLTGGFLVREKYEDIDLSTYNSSVGTNWGTRGIPQNVIKRANKNKIKTVTLIQNLEQARDLLANGYAFSVCSNYGFSQIRNQHGISEPEGSWAHAMAWIGCDDTRERSTEILFLVQNSWGIWNTGPKVHDQPEGSFWIRGSVAEAMIAEGAAFAYSDFEGFVKKMNWQKIKEVYS